GATLTGNSNGALAAIDGVTLTQGQSVLVQNQAAPAQNGIYTLTTVGDGSNPFVLTRRSDMNLSAEFLPGGLIFVLPAGSPNTNGGALFNYSGAAAPTVGATNITFSPYSKSAAPFNV